MSWRYEIKYRASGDLGDIGRHVILANRSLRQSFPPRRVNSIYLDTPLMESATDNLAGIADRTKHRLRCYGDEEDFSSSVYEIKTRNGRLGSKEAFTVRFGSTTSMYASTDRWAALQENARLRMLLARCQPMSPTLGVHYDREYFSNADGVRVTIDHRLQFRDLRHSAAARRISLPDQTISIIEVKFPPECRVSAQEIINSLPLQPVRNSKYVLGLSCINSLVYL